MRLTALATALLGLSTLAPAGQSPFTPGNFVAVRVGDGTSTLINTGNRVFLEEFTPAGTPVQAVPLRSTVEGTQRQCILSGTATSEGMLTRAGDGSRLILGCYARDLGGTGNLASTTAAAVNRVIAVIGADASIDTSTALADAHTGNNIRSAASQDGSSFYSAGGNEGVRASLLGASSSSVLSSTTATGNLTNLRNLGIWGGNLYVTNASGTNARLQQVGSGLPTAAGTQMAAVPGMPTDRSFYGFHFADRSTEVAGVDTLYVADDSATAPGAGILKYSLVGGSWVANGRVAMSGARGLAAQADPAGYLIVVAAEADCATGAAAASTSRLCGVLDTGGYNQPFTPAGPGLTLATAAANTVYRGVANAPMSASAPGVLAINPTALDFGTLPVGTTSPAQTVTLSNTGGSALTVSSLSDATAPFARSGGSCPTPIVLAAGANCTLSYTYAPTAPGLAEQNLSVAAGTAGSGSIRLSGTAGASADLSIIKTSNLSLLDQGLMQYTLVIGNAGPSAVNAATVTDTFASSFSAVTWTCVGINGGSCVGAGSGNLDQPVNLPAGGALYYAILASIPLPLPAQLSNTASVTAPSGVTDPVPGNNSSTVTDTIRIFANGFESLPTQPLEGNAALQRLSLPAAALAELAQSADPTLISRFDSAGQWLVLQVRRIGGQTQAQLLRRDARGNWQADAWQDFDAQSLIQLEWQGSESVQLRIGS
ncbi:MAG: choice-of-anchor D domain-containing protein [Xanthomonadales bacterium]|nr:choice-of-anchor D domain-containing protein [Xanthomonadales bacterium]